MIRKMPSLLAAGSTLALAGCGLLGSSPSQTPVAGEVRTTGRLVAGDTRAQADGKGVDVVVFALGLVETGYRFGGKNPEAGLDCSGMVSYVFANAAGLRLSGSAADMARQGRPIEPTQLRPGDLVFFNTGGRPYSHVGIYIGDGRFVHSPSSGGRVRTESMREGWFAARFVEARSYFN